MKRILCVLRESTEKQEIESQKKEMLDFCLSLGYKEKEIEWIEAVGASARKVNAKYSKMLEDIKSTILSSKTINSCAFWHLNRLGRIDTKIIEMKNWFVKNGVQVYIKTPTLVLLQDDGSINTAAELSWGIFATMIQQETNEMFAKTSRGKARNAANQKFNGGKCVKFGYKLDSNNYIVPDKKEAKLVKLIFDEYSTGKYSIIKLARELTKRGYKQRNDELIKEPFVRKILISTAYIGYSYYLDIKRNFTPIISKELWDKCAKIRVEKEIISTKEKTTHLCTKLVKCPICGRSMIYNNGHYRCYYQREKLRTVEEKNPCENPIAINSVLMDRIVWDLASTKQLELIRKADSKLIKELDRKRLIASQKAEESNKKLLGLSERKQRIIDLYTEGDLTKQQYEDKRGKIIKDSVSYQVEIDRYLEEEEGYRNQIDQLKIDNIFDYSELAQNTAQMRDIVFTHLSKAIVEEEKIDNKRCRVIKITDKKGVEYKYYYWYRQQRKTKGIDVMDRVNNNERREGNIILRGRKEKERGTKTINKK